MKRYFVVALLGSSALAAPGYALAQPAGSAAQTPPANPEQSTPDSAANATPAQGAPANSQPELVVTGSRVTTNRNSPTPLTTLPAQQIQSLNPGSLTEAVTLLPALSSSQNISSRPGGGQRNGAGAYFNLRNLGNLRTLVLFDGQRLTPTINQNEADVDASIIPQLLISRVDVVTGGVSAVYGSDAVSGVINFVTDRHFNGVRITGSQSVSTYGDDPISDIGVAAGTRFAGGRGHIEVSYQFHHDDGILNREDSQDRAFYAANTGFAGAGSAANPYFNVPDMRLSNTTFGGLIISSSNAADTTTLRNLQFSPTGQLSAFVHGLVPVAGGTFAPFGTAGITLASANVESGGNGAYFPTSSLKSSIEFHQAFGRLDYDLTDNIHAYAQLAYSHVVTQAQFRSPSFTANAGSLRFSYANPFLQLTQQPYAALFAANPTRTLNLNEVLLNDPANRQTTESWIALAGVDGELGHDWHWNVNVGHQQSTILAEDLFNIDRGRLAAALDAVNSGGTVVCRAAATNSAYAGCVPLNIFGGLQAASPQALAYIYTPTFNRNRTRMDSATASLTGTPFSTWAGPVRVALSGEWRRLSWNAVTNTDPNQLANCTGISFNCTQGTTLRWFNNTMGAVPLVTQRVTEGALEVNVPLLRDSVIARSLSVTGAVRYTNYSTSGNVTTWKVGADWRIIDDIRLRATRSRDIRAPNLFDLYTSTQVNCGISAVDSLTSTTYNNICNTQGSNPNLTPEFANTLTVGAVLTPHFLRGFTATFDYYKIDVRNVILLQQGFSTPVLNYCATIAGAAPVCALVTRANWTDRNPATNPITATRSQSVNVATLRTWGVDTELSYVHPIAGHELSLRALISYQPRIVYDQGPSGVLSIAGAYNAGSNRFGASPVWRVTGVASYDVTDHFNITVLERWRNGLDAIYDPNLVVVQPRLPSIAYTNFTLTWRMGEEEATHYEFYAGVANLFNKFPTVYYTGQPALPSSQPFVPEGDDILGRVFTVGARVRF